MSEYPLVRMGTFLRERKEFVTIDDLEIYKRAKVQWYGKGIILRDKVAGSEIKTKQQQVIRTDEFVVAEIDAKDGSFGVTPEKLEGAIVSSHYFVYEINKNICLPSYLEWYVRTNNLQSLVKAQGSTNYSAIRSYTVYDYEIPIPPLIKQISIVECIEALAASIAKAQFLRDEAEQEADALIESTLNSVVQDLEKKYETKLLEELIVEASYGTSVKCYPERENGSIPVLRIPNVASEKVTLTNLKFGSLSKSEFDKTVLKQGDILVVRTNGSAELVGRCAVVPELHEPMAFASYMIRIRCNQEVILSDFLQLVLRQQRTAGFLFDFARTSAGQYNVSLGRLKMTKIPIPPLDEQRRIVAYLDSVQARLASLRELQSATGEELSALLPSVLDRAFKGEL